MKPLGCGVKPAKKRSLSPKFGSTRTMFSETRTMSASSRRSHRSDEQKPVHKTGKATHFHNQQFDDDEEDDYSS